MDTTAKNSCDCIAKIKRKLEEHHNSEIDLGLKFFISNDLKQMGDDIPPFYYWYKVGGKWKKSYVHFAFCPFCGVNK